MMVSDDELSTDPALDDIVRIRPGVLPGGHDVTYRLNDGPLPGGQWFVVSVDGPGTEDWAGTIDADDILTITRLIESGVITWAHAPGASTQTESTNQHG